MSVFHFGLVLILLEVGRGFSDESGQCQPGFSTESYVFKVTRKILERGRVLGKVFFDDCTGRRLRPYNTEETRIRINPDGTVSVKRQMQLHEDLKTFAVHAWDSAGKKFSSQVVVRHDHLSTQPSTEKSAEVLYFPKSPQGLSRQKRDWDIPLITVSENERGPFPKRLVQIKSSKDKETKVFYSLTGKGADTPPEGVFIIERATGWILVTIPLDREDIAEYVLFFHAVQATGQPIEEPIKTIVHVIDQNDNRPSFTQSVFNGQVAEGSQPGTSVMQVTATDRDDSVNSYNGVVFYTIVDQEPKLPNDMMFTINKETGLISVISTGLVRKKVPRYTLTLQAADFQGTGLKITATAVIEVTSTNDKPFECKDMSASPDSPLTTHVLNTVSGTPAEGLQLQLSRLDVPTQRWVVLTSSSTNSDGRCPGFLSRERFTAGTYKVHFETGEFWKQLGQTSFYPYVEIVFTILDPCQKYHIPLLLSPFSYTTYRGS